MPKRTCTINGCGKRPHGRGLCKKHHTRLLRHGDPHVKTRFFTPEESLKARLQEDDGCLIWTGAINHSGYGQIRARERTYFAHRLAWELVNGEIPKGMHIDHICHTPACCNVEHLRLATRSQNQANRVGAASDSRSGVRNVIWKRDRWVVRLTKNGKRYSFGSYLTIEEAADVAARARKDLFGEFAGQG